MQSALCLTAVLVPCMCLYAQDDLRALIEWQFDQPGQLEGWGSPNHITDLRVEDGALQGRIMDWDPFVRSPQFEIAASPRQAIQLRLKTDCGGDGEFFWTNTTESQYGGFSPGKETHFSVIGDNEWHVYQVFPFWHREGNIILLRLDLPRPDPADAGKKTFAVDYIRIVEFAEAGAPRTEPTWDFTGGSAWVAIEGASLRPTDDGMEVTVGDDGEGVVVSDPLDLPVNDRFWVSVEMAVDGGHSASLRWVSTEYSGLQARSFPVRADGRFHHYNIDLASAQEWSGTLLLLGLSPSATPGAKATVRSLAVSEDPLGPPQIEVTYAGLENAVNRASSELPFIMSLTNRGGDTATDLRIAEVSLPGNVTVAETANWRRIGPVEPFDPTSHRFHLSATAPAKGRVEITLAGTGAPDEPVRGEILIEPSLNLPKADYVPEPQPVESDYEIGALYFPGWDSVVKWEPIRRVAPERKPVLGWYDEGNPECADWQIKWAVEHGIRFLLVDWYWSAGSRHLEHWVHSAYMNSRYRRYLKWCMMWANHNPAGTHSEADQRAVTQYWIDNYFGMEEYYRIDDMPVVMVWSPQNMRRDMAGKGGARRLLDISQEMARAAGYKGIYFVAMKWPEAGTDPELIEPLRDDGFSMTSIYHYMGHGGKAEEPKHYPFELVAESTYPFFEAWHEADILPFLPNLSTGWASQPWHGDRATVIYGRTVELFRRICEDAKRFADQTGVKRMVLAPLNEWGEGSYAEPCKEFGFGMYDAVRDTFCKRPPGGWPLNVAPQDVGLGPYDYPEPEQRFVWDFGNGAQAWSRMMGIGDFEAREGALHLTTTSRDPAITVGLYDVNARTYPFIVIRMRIDKLAAEGEGAQMFWTTPTARTSEAASVKFELIGDGEYHTYVLPVGENSRWRGRITTLRFDPCSHADAQISIEEIKLSKDGK